MELDSTRFTAAGDRRPAGSSPAPRCEISWGSGVFSMGSLKQQRAASEAGPAARERPPEPRGSAPRRGLVSSRPCLCHPHVPHPAAQTGGPRGPGAPLGSRASVGPSTAKPLPLQTPRSRTVGPHTGRQGSPGGGRRHSGALGSLRRGPRGGEGDRFLGGTGPASRGRAPSRRPARGEGDRCACAGRFPAAWRKALAVSRLLATSAPGAPRQYGSHGVALQRGAAADGPG